MEVAMSGREATTLSRRQAILQAALTSFTTKGYTETTMEDIRRISGASTGSIYHHFENKEKLALALYLEGRNDLDAHLVAAMTAASDPRESIQSLVKAYLDWYEQHPDLGQHMLQVTSTETLAPQVAALRQTFEPFSKQLFDWLLPFINAGAVKSFPQTLYFPFIIGPSREFVRRWLVQRDLTEFQAAREPLIAAAWTVLAPASEC